jgi:hypothetical protein
VLLQKWREASLKRSGGVGAALAQAHGFTAFAFTEILSIHAVTQPRASLGKGRGGVSRELRKLAGLVSLKAFGKIRFDSTRGVEELALVLEVNRLPAISNEAVHLEFELNSELKRDKVLD